MRALLSLQQGCLARAAAPAAGPVPRFGKEHVSVGWGGLCAPHAFGASALPTGRWAGSVPREVLPCR